MFGSKLRKPLAASASATAALVLSGVGTALALTVEIANPWDVAGGAYEITAHPHCHGPGWTIPGRTGDGMTCVSGYDSPHPSEYQMSDMSNGAGGPNGDSVYFKTNSISGFVVRGYVVAIGHPTGCTGQDVVHLRVEAVNIYSGVVVDVGSMTYGHLYGQETAVSAGQYVPYGTKIGCRRLLPN